jgi:hypothetical protein
MDLASRLAICTHRAARFGVSQPSVAVRNPLSASTTVPQSISM